MENTLTIPDLIKAAGGPTIIQAELERVGSALTRDAIYKWQKTGIPDRYWFAMIALANCTTDQLYEANCAARSGHVLSGGAGCLRVIDEAGDAGRVSHRAGRYVR